MSHADVLRQAVAAHQSGRLQDARVGYAQVLAAEPGNAWANYFRSVLADQEGEAEVALVHLRRSAEVADAPVQALVALGNKDITAGRFAAALRSFIRAEAMRPALAAAATGTALALKRLGRLDEALAAARRALVLRRGWQPGTAHPLGELDPGEIEQISQTNRVKLRHDAAQLRHLHHVGALDDSFLAIAETYDGLADSLSHLPHETSIAVLDGPALAATRFTYNRLLYTPNLGPVPDPVLSPMTPFGQADVAFGASRPTPVVIDNVLSSEALSALQRLCREATIWFEVKDHGSHLGAYFEEGLGCELTIAISRALQKALPLTLGELRLVQLWAYKHGHGGGGTDYHADIGRVSANLWIAADEASLDQHSGGLEVWPVEMPADWDFRQSNVDRAGIRSMLQSSEVQPVNIPHRCNRLVLFDANLFHRTAPGLFAEGYGCQRINITFLYDDPVTSSRSARVT